MDETNTKIEVELPNNLKFLETENSKSPILGGIENLKIELIKKVFETNYPEFLPYHRRYFTEEEVNNLVKSIK